nr:MAG TPA: hypothetical protein [Caudoviricetes sp.]
MTRQETERGRYLTTKQRSLKNTGLFHLEVRNTLTQRRFLP